MGKTIQKQKKMNPEKDILGKICLELILDCIIY